MSTILMATCSSEERKKERKERKRKRKGKKKKKKGTEKEPKREEAVKENVRGLEVTPKKVDSKACLCPRQLMCRRLHFSEITLTYGMAVD